MSKELVQRLREYGDYKDPCSHEADCVEAADFIERQDRLIQDMFAVLINRCDEKDPKVKDVLIRAIELQPDTPEEGE